MQYTKKAFVTLLLSFVLMNASAQSNQTVTRIAIIKIDPPQLAAYKKLLKEQMETAVRVEEGVISYYVYADKADATKITIVEVYASDSAYQKHRESPHFKKYKAAVNDMVKSLELSEVDTILIAKKGRG
jgi:quinol monooxygenase YgiN